MKQYFITFIKSKDTKYLFPLTIFSLFVAGLIFISYGYVDLKMLTVWSLNLLDVTWEGNIFNYYEYCSYNFYNLECAYMGSNFLALIPWSIWNIPIWIIQKWFGKDAIGHAWMLLYSKIFLFLVLVLTLYYTYKIIKYLRDDRESILLAIYLSFSSPFVMIGIGYAGQTDIISICLFVIAVYKLLIDKKRSFIIFSALSIGAKPYVLLPFIALILLTEKKIWKIFLKTLSGCSIMILFHLIFMRAPMLSDGELQSGATAN